MTLTRFETQLLGTSFELHKSGLTITGKPSKEEYLRAFNTLSVMEGAIHWWIGDLAQSCEGHYGALKEFAEQMPFEYQTIKNDAWVAGRYELSHRWDNLSWKHHSIVAARDDRLEWLQKAAENGWSAAELERKVKTKSLIIPTATKPILKLGDFIDLAGELSDGSISLILTDPPYGKEWLDGWRQLADLGNRVLTPDGFLVTFTGQFYLPQVVAALGSKLRYFWTAAILLPQGNRQEFQTKVVNNWKPALIYTKGERAKDKLDWWVDITKSRLEKDLDEWQQSVDIARYFVKTFSPPDGQILDPCAGTGTFLLAAQLEGRNAVGFERELEHYRIAMQRLGCSEQ